ncbi:MAG: response regulator [Candidatus Omnitrophica bacterium]|nr:response regulator [Candidatus Omnitrophota bacterium]
MVKNRILVLDDEKVVQQLLVRTFGEDRYHVEAAEDSGAALKRMKEEPFDLLITDLKMPGASGMDLLKEVKSVNPHTEVIIITGYPTIELAVEAVKMGAFDFICKPFDLAGMKTTVDRCLEKQRSGPKIEASIDYANSIIGTLREPFLVLDKRLRVISANHAFYAAFEVAEKETIGRPLPDLGDRQWNIPKLLQLLREVIPERKVVKDYDVKHKFEKIGERAMILNACQLRISNKMAAMITKRAVGEEEEDLILLAIQDITGRKLLENDLKKAEVIKASAEMKSKFASMVSHELRSPMAVIKESINLVLEGLLGSVTLEQKDVLGTAKSNIDRLGRLINNVLDFQKMEAGKMELDSKENDINELILMVSKEKGFEADNKGLGLTVNLDEDTRKIKFDHDKIVQVVTNLLSNAIKFTEKGGISITTKSEDNVVHVMVEDTGPGIRTNDVFRLFQAFEQLGGGPGKKRGGTGLGLAISKEIILAHNGKIWAESQFGKGSTFHFTLPIKERRG